MADRYWIRGTAGVWNDTANWSTTSGGSGGASVPTSADNVFFNSGGIGACSLDRNEECNNITFNTSWGNRVFGMAGFSLTVHGDFDGGTDSHPSVAVSFVVGSGTLELKGNVAPARMAWASPYTGNITVSGTSKTWTTYFQGSSLGSGIDLNFTGSTTITGTSLNFPLLVTGAGSKCTISGSVVCGNSGKLSINQSEFQITSTGSLSSSGDGCLEFAGHSTGGGGVFTVSSGASLTALVVFASYRLNLGANAVFDGPVVFKSWTVSADEYTFNAGTYTFNYSVKFESDYGATWNFGGSAKAINYIFKESVTRVGTSGTYTKGTGTISFEGTADQSVDFNGHTVEDFEIDKTAGTVTLTDNVTTDSLLLTDGTLDLGGFDLTTSSNFTVAAGGVVQDTPATGSIAVGGNFALNGASGAGNGVTWTDADVVVTGTAVATYAAVSDSDATGGTEIDASDGTSTDGGGNTNWSFGDAGGVVGETSLAFSNTGLLKGIGKLSGSVSLSFSNTGALSGSGRLFGSSSLSFAPSGLLEAIGDLEGTTDLTFPTTGVLKATGHLSGSTSLSFTTSGVFSGIKGYMRGSSAISFSPTATPSARGRLSGSTQVSFTPVGTLVAGSVFRPWFSDTNKLMYLEG